jgi:hypothetical protein
LGPPRRRHLADASPGTGQHRVTANSAHAGRCWRRTGGSTAEDNGRQFQGQAELRAGVLTEVDSGNCKQTNAPLQANWQATSKAKLGLNWGDRRLKDGAATDLRSNTN